MEDQRIFLMGGTFNPPHLGHARVVSEIDRRYGPDLILLIPTGTPPHKQLPAGAAAAEDRLAMLSLCMPKRKNIQISDMEIRRPGKSYTLDTLRELKEKYAGGVFFLVMGSDMLFSLETWYEFKEIFKLCTIVAVSREKGEKGRIEEYAEVLRARFGAQIEIMEMEPFEVSSSHIRNMVKCKEDISPFVGEPVSKYIAKRRLYSD